MILILQQASSTVRWHKTLAQKMATTWWQDLQNRIVIATTWLKFTRKTHTVPLVHLQGSKIKNHPTSQPHFRSVNNPAKIQADQILLALQQLANSNSSANFHNIINRISKLPKSLTTTMPTFDGKSENFELFEDLFQTSLKIHNHLTEVDRINYFILSWGEMRYKLLKTLMAQPERTWENSSSFSKEVRKIPVDGNIKTQIPETCLQPSKSKVSRFSW